MHRHIGAIKVELNILNSLISSKNIEQDFKNLIIKYPETLKCIPLLLAVRTKEIYAIDAEGEFSYAFINTNHSLEQYAVFMKKTRLFDLLEKPIINNLADYATGVETGLDSNGRKNRGGHLMENLVEDYIQKAGFIKDISYFKEMPISRIESQFDIDLSAISNRGKPSKGLTLWYLLAVLFMALKPASMQAPAQSLMKLQEVIRLSHWKLKIYLILHLYGSQMVKAGTVLNIIWQKHLRSWSMSIISLT